MNVLFPASAFTLSWVTMNRRAFAINVFTLIFTSACLFRGKKDRAAGPKVFDVLGSVEQVTASSISIKTDQGAVETFAMNASTVRGGDFRPGMYVHVYYYQQPNQNLATMVVEKVK